MVRRRRGCATAPGGCCPGSAAADASPRCIAPRRIAGRRRRPARRLRNHFQHLRRARAPLARRAPPVLAVERPLGLDEAGSGGGPVNLPPIVENAEWAQAGGTIRPTRRGIRRWAAGLAGAVAQLGRHRLRLPAPPDRAAAGGRRDGLRHGRLRPGHGAGRGERAAALANRHAAATGPRRRARRRHRLRGRAALRRHRPGGGDGDRSGGRHDRLARSTARAGARRAHGGRRARSSCRRWRTTCSRFPSRMGGGSGPTGRSRPPP